jgi:hypothetical protein
MNNITKIIIVRISSPNVWYKNMKGKTFHIFGHIDNPILINNNYICIENSFFIFKDDVIFITN